MKQKRMKMKLLILLTTWGALVAQLGAPLTAHAQLDRNARAAEAMRQLDYPAAIELYKLTLRYDANNAEAIANIAECYRKTNQTKEAEYWYGKAVQLAKPKPLHFLYYGMTLHRNGKCAEAVAWYERYAREAPSDSRTQRLIQGCAKREAFLKKGQRIYQIEKTSVNSDYNEYAPSLSGESLFFASERPTGKITKRVNAWNNAPFARVYASGVRPREGWTPEVDPQARHWDSPYQTQLHQAGVVFSADGRWAFVTRSDQSGRSEDGLVRLKIYAARRFENGSWGNLEELPFNNAAYSTAHPAPTPDGERLFFSSNRPGGYGGMDLYVVEQRDGVWGIPFNLGPDVNTEGHEIFPFFSQEGRLYFASDGHESLGGLDILYTTARGGSDWNAPLNPGAPLNSEADDFAICFEPEGRWGFFASNREDGKVDNLYAFSRTAIPVTVRVESEGRPLSDAAVTLDLSGETINSDAQGVALFDLFPGDCVTFLVEKNGCEPASVPYCAAAGAEAPIAKLTRKSRISIQGLVFDMTDGLPAQGVSVALLNDCGQPQVTQVSAADGRFSFPLSRNCCYTVRAEAPGYLAAVSEKICAPRADLARTFKVWLNLQPFRDGEGFLIKPPSRPSYRYNPESERYELPDGKPANIELGQGLSLRDGILYDQEEPANFRMDAWAKADDGQGFTLALYYDLDAVYPKEESYGELEKLLRLLLNNPKLEVEIASHTDARGSAAYNAELSQRRADYIAQWLRNQGINETRIRAQGYGNSRPARPCGPSSVPCTEEMNRANRRTEFRIIDRN